MIWRGSWQEVSVVLAEDFTAMLPISMFISRQSVGILENKTEVLVTCRQVPDPQVQVQVPSTTSLLERHWTDSVFV